MTFAPYNLCLAMECKLPVVPLWAICVHPPQQAVSPGLEMWCNLKGGSALFWKLHLKVRLYSVLLKTEKDLSHRKGPKRIFGHRKGLLFAIFILLNICFRTSDIILILIST